MNKYLLSALVVILSLFSFKTQQPNFGEPGKHESYLRIIKSGCYGKCPRYTVTLFKNGLLTYEGLMYVDKIGKFYTVLKGSELAGWEKKIKEADLMNMADKYPEHYMAPQDIPSIIITYSEKGKTKKITDYGYNDPWELHTLIPAIDSLVNSKKLQSYDK